MHARTQLHLHAGAMTDAEVGEEGADQIEGHVCNLSHMAIAVKFGDSADHHVGVPNGFHLIMKI